MKITLTCNIRPNFSEEFIEWDEPETIQKIKEGLSSLNHDVTVLDCHLNDIEKKLKEYSPHHVFNIAEGFKGSNREGIVPEILDKLHIPYTGSNALTLNNCLDKAKAKEIFVNAKIPTPLFYKSEIPLKKLPKNFKYPVIIKPLHEGSSKGIKDSSLVKDDLLLFKITDEVIKKFNQPFILEEFLNGREFTVAMIGNGNDIEILPIVEIDFSLLPKNANPIYGYEAKWIWDTVDAPLKIFKCPAELNDKLKKEIEDIALKTFNAVDCKDWCRMDLRLDNNENVNVLEINPLPGIIPDPDANSCFPKAARTKGYSYVDILEKVLNASLKRYNKI